MYNEQLEQLIDAALADGVLTEKEKQILFKKAQALGVDLDEFEMVLDARLVKLKKAEEEKAASSAPKSNKLGDVKKCPACGAMVQSYQGVCPECGYAFEGVDANATITKLSNLLNKCGDSYDSYKKRAEIIRTFPIPNTKADLFDLIMYFQANKTKDRFDMVSPAMENKMQECIFKVKTLFSNDSQLMNLVSQIETEEKKIEKKEKRENTLDTILIIIPIIVGIAAIVLEWVFLDWSSFWIIMLNIITFVVMGFIYGIIEFLRS